MTAGTPNGHFEHTGDGPPEMRVVCSRCHATVSVSRPEESPGWHVVHRCGDYVIETLTPRAGRTPFAWRVRPPKEHPGA